MGYYINPTDETKEEFLHRYGSRVGPGGSMAITDKEYPVCLVDRQAFTAAAILYSKAEMEEFCRLPALKQFFMVPRNVLKEFLPEDLW